jgi:hypothetical protein
MDLMMRKEYEQECRDPDLYAWPSPALLLGTIARTANIDPNLTRVIDRF